MPPKRRRKPSRRRCRNSSSIPPDTIDEIRRKITEQEEKIIREFRSLDNCNDLFNRWRYKKRQDDEAGRGYKARQKLYDLNKKLKKRIQEEEIECQLAEIYSLSPRLDKLRVGDNDSEDGDDEMEEVELQAGADDSMSNNVSNNAMMRQVANGISFRSNHLETALGERDSGMEEAPEEHHIKTMTTLLLR